MKRLILILLIFLLPLSSCGMGPIYTGAHTATWDAVTGATGYYIYWRTPGTQTWLNNQRAQTTAVTLDLTAVGIPQGSWELCATAFDPVSESGPSNVVTWQYSVRGPPTNAKIQ